MYFTTLPDHSKPGFDEQLHFSKFKKQNIIFNAVSENSNCDRHVGCLSIKTVLSGEEWYGVNGRQIAVRPGQFLMLNDEQEYSCRIDTPAQTRVLSIFFRKEFAQSVFFDASSTEHQLLENPHDESTGRAVEFFQTLNWIHPTLREKMMALVGTLNDDGYHADTVDEHLIFILRDLIRMNDIESTRALQVKGVRPATRKEIHKRLNVAKDLMHSNFMTSPSLSFIGREASLSTAQLVRQFNAVFGVTPHRYLVALRLAHAAQLLKNTTMPIQDVTWTCGFQNASAFCRAFKGEFGLSPNAFRSPG